MAPGPLEGGYETQGPGHTRHSASKGEPFAGIMAAVNALRPGESR